MQNQTPGAGSEPHPGAGAGKADAQASRPAAERSYRQLFDGAREGILVLDAATGAVLDANPSLLGLVGYAREEVLAQRPWELGFLMPLIADEIAFAAWRERGCPSHEEAILECRDGRPFEVEFSSSVCGPSDARVIQCYVRDIGSRRRAEAREAHIKRVLLAVRSVNRLIIQEGDPLRLIERACENLTETLGYHNAWVALFDGAGRNVIAMAAVGLAGEFGALRERLLRGEFPACMERALASDETLVVADPAAHCPDCPLAGAYRGRSGFSHRLALGGGTYGVLAVSVPAAYADDAEERGLFAEVAGDLAYALHRIEESRRLSDVQRRYRLIFEGSRDGFVMVDAAAHITDANQAYCEMLGYTLDELRGLKDFYAVTPARWQAWEAQEIWAGRLLTHGASGRYEKEYIRKDGTVFPIELQAHAVRDGAGAIEYLWATVRDISARRQAEARLEFQALLLRTIQDFVVATDLDGRITYVNEATCKALGRPRDELLGATVQLLGQDPGAGATQDEIVQRTREAGRWRGEVVNVGAHGERVVLDCRTRLLRDAEGAPTGMVGVSSDVTERRRAEGALRESERRNRLLSDVTMEGIVIHRNAVAIDANASMARLLGLEREALFQRDFMEFIHPDDRALVRGNMVKESAPPYTVRIVRPDGKVFFAEIESRNFRHEGEVWRASAVRDISARKALEAQLVQAQKMESVGRLAGGVAHDFNNLLMGIMGYTDLCRDEIAPDHPVRHWLDEITKEAQRSANLTRQLLAFARKQTVAPKVLDLNSAVDGMLTMLRRLIGEDIDLSWRPSSALWPVHIDPGQIDQILANLCVNARDAISGVGKVTLETANVTMDGGYCAAHVDVHPGDYVRLAISDDGCGMGPETLSHLFEPFFTTKPVGEGTGLGLATVYGIVKQNGGDISVYSELGKGTTFRVYMPRATVAAADRPPRVEAAPKAPRGSETVLLVEDEASLRVTCRLFLAGFGYTVLVAESPEVALRLAGDYAGAIHLLITDVVMPGMSGRDLAGRLSRARPDMLCLFISGYTANVIAHRGILDDNVSFLAKPFNRDELARKVRGVLDGL